MRNPMLRAALVALVFAAAVPAFAAATREAHPGQRAFAREVAAEAKRLRLPLDAPAVEKQLAGAKFQQSIIDAMTRPAEKTKPWREYRPIFLADRRISDGIAFYRENRALLEAIGRQYGVPPELVVAIVGVETNYGRITGRYRVIDALVTLAFYYPPRADFFRGELKQLLLLPGEAFPYAIDELTGSYAGAMGWGQFMPTSWAKYARDHDADGTIDLWRSKPDIFASIANYFVGYGWRTGAPVAHRAAPAPTARGIRPAGYEPVYSVGQLAAWGYHAAEPLDPDLPATLLELDGAEGPEFWLIHPNFYVITRYNRSPMYSLAVHQLAQAIAAGVAGDAGRTASAARGAGGR
jgi:membrane-bound lytic murein transglycosylase B